MKLRGGRGVRVRRSVDGFVVELADAGAGAVGPAGPAGADGDGWQLDGVEGRAYDLRVRSWTEVVVDGRWGVRAARLLAP